jgi:GT2 family glycosyltransferase
VTIPAETTVVVVTWQGAHLLPHCLASVGAQTLPHELIVVDNASTDGTASLLTRDFPQASVVTLADNAGFAGGVAAALAEVRTPYLALLNNDAAADPAWLERSVAELRADADVAAVTAKLLLWDSGRINNAGVVLTRDGYGADRGLDQPDGPPYDSAAEVFGLSGGAAVLRTDAVRATGGVPARFFLYYEDTDLAWRLRLGGWRIRYRPDAVVRHRHAATSKRDSPVFAYYNERNRLLMLLRCAPAGFAVRQIVRFCVTSASLAMRRAIRQQVPDVPVFRTRLRLRVLAGVARCLPWALRSRRAIGRHATVARRVVAAEWVGE